MHLHSPTTTFSTLFTIIFGGLEIISIMDYIAWDTSIQNAINSLDTTCATTRSQQFLQKFPTALTAFRAHLSTTSFDPPLAPFQSHPTYLLRFLLAEWKDESIKQYRTSLDTIIKESTSRLLATQKWRVGQDGDEWKRWGFKNMDDLYNNYKTTQKEDEALQKWWPQRFMGLDGRNHPLHMELLPNTYEEKLVIPMAIRRIVNNEHTLRVRIPALNPAPPSLLEKAGLKSQPGLEAIDIPITNRSDTLTNPILGATWILDARQLSLWYSSAIWKTGSALIEHSNKITSAHYPEQGYRALILNLGVVFGSMYNMAMKVLPATVQSNTRCFVGKDCLYDKQERVFVSEGQVPGMYRESKQKSLTKDEEHEVRWDVAPFVVK